MIPFTGIILFVVWIAWYLRPGYAARKARR